MDASSFATREGVKAQQLRWWRWQLGLGPRGRRAADAPQFVEVVLEGRSEPPVPARAEAELELVIGQRRVLVRPGFDAESLRQVVAVLEEG
jgi:hypothetical protein